MTKLSNYKSHVFEMLPQLESLDGYNKLGEEVLSEDESDYGAYGEEGEADLDNEFVAQNLSEAQLEELKKRGISVEDFLNGKAGSDIAFGDEEGEEDFNDDYGDESGEAEDPEAAGKEAKE